MIVSKLTKIISIFLFISHDIRGEDCYCGVAKPYRNDTSRIQGGHEADYNEWPWLVAIVSSHDPVNPKMCSGTILNSRWILTSALSIGDAEGDELMVS